MTFWQFLNDNMGILFVCGLLFGGSLGTGCYQLVCRLLSHREKQTAERTRQLELRLEIARAERTRQPVPPSARQGMPKQEYAQPAPELPYEQGYQGMEIVQRLPDSDG